MKLRFEDLPTLVNCHLVPSTLKGALGTSNFDSRLIQPGETFWALRSEKADGHDHIAAAFARGAPAAVVSEDWFAQHQGLFGEAAFVVVKDTLTALQDLGRAHRQRFQIPVIALTGSNGKTSTKEMLAAALATRSKVLKSPGNFNNHIGVPLTLLQMDEATQIVLIEMGTNHPGEITALSAMARPTAGMVLNVAAAHLEGFESIEGVAREKEALYQALPADGVAFFNLDDPFVRTMASPAKKQIGYGFQAEAGRDRCDRVVIGKRIVAAVNSGNGNRFSIEGITFALRWRGVHHLNNALAAATVAEHFGVTWTEIAAALAELPPIQGRLKVLDAGGITIIDDSYNANPASTKAALDFLISLDVRGRRIAVLGDHLELGKASANQHREIGKLLLHPAIHGALLIGDQMRHAWAEYSGCGKMAVYYDYTEDYDDIVDVLLKILRPGDAILIKASRGMGLDRIVAGLVQQLDQSQAARKVEA